MSVLIEELTLVARKAALDAAYPGGTDAFLRAVRALDCPPRFVDDGDETLVILGFDDAGHLAAAAALLREHDEPERLFPLGVRDGCEVWLDLQSGQQVVGPPCEEALVPDDTLPADDPFAELEPGDLPDGTPLLERVMDALGEREWGFELAIDAPAECPVVLFRVRGQHTAYECSAQTNEVLEQVIVNVSLPARVPEERRAAACEFVARANWGLAIGGFQIDLEEGTVRVRVGTDVEGGTLTTPMVHTMFSAALSTFDLYYPALMRILYADAAPAEAIREVELRWQLEHGRTPDEDADAR